MRSHRLIGPAQAEAGNYFQRLYESAQIGSAGAIDPAKIRVDQSGVPNTLTDRAAGAMEALAMIRPHLGKVDYRIVELVAGEGRTVSETTKIIIANASERDRNYVSKRLRDALSALAEYLGLTGKAKGRRKVRGGAIR